MKRPIFLVLIAILFLSCTAKHVRIELVNIQIDKLLEQVRKSEKSVRSVSGVARINIESPERNLSFKQVTIAQEPNLMRLESLDPFGRTVGLISSDGKQIHYIFPEQKVVYDNLETFNLSNIYPYLPQDITVDNLVSLLLGRLPEQSLYGGSPVSMKINSNRIVLTFTQSGKNQTILWINSEIKRIEKAKIRLNNGSRATFRFENFKQVKTVLHFPLKIELETEEFSILLNYDQDVEVNVDIDKNLFRPEPYLVGFRP